MLPTPMMGGVAVYLAFACTAVLLLPPSRPLAGVLLGGLAAVVVGVIDELVDLPVLLHAGGQIAAAVVGILAGLGVVQSLSVPFEGLTGPGFHIPALVGLMFTVIWLVGMMNAMNFLDGLDGLVTGVATLAAILLAIWASEPNRFYLPAAHRQDLLLPLALAGALLGFLPYNWHVARIFLGDSGSMFVGFAIGALAIVGPAKLGTALLVLLIPVLDVAWAVVRRQLSGRSFLTGDKQHVYHRMLELGLGYRSTVLILYSLCLALAGLDWALLKLAKLIAFLILALVIAGAFVVLEFRASGRAQLEALPPASLNARAPH
jgi:UDP-GlcNAc:undecaprenyl-phosphate GlcNAc-1-phosphate transferase